MANLTQPGQGHKPLVKVDLKLRLREVASVAEVKTLPTEIDTLAEHVRAGKGVRLS